MSDVTIYHNPRCSKSRQALQLLRDRGVEPVVVEYLTTPLEVAKLKTLLKKLRLTARDILRDGEEEFRKLHLDRPQKTEDEILAAIAKHPILLQRPIVVHGDNAVLARPPERLKELL